MAEASPNDTHGDGVHGDHANCVNVRDYQNGLLEGRQNGIGHAQRWLIERRCLLIDVVITQIEDESSRQAAVLFDITNSIGDTNDKLMEFNRIGSHIEALLQFRQVLINDRAQIETAQFDF